MLMSLGIILVGVVFWLMAYKEYKTYQKKEKQGADSEELWKCERRLERGLTIAGIFTLCIAITATILLCVAVKKPLSRIEYQEERASLEIRLETYLTSDKEIELKDMEWQELYKEIAEFNATVRKHKYGSESIVFNWYYNKGIGEIEPIDYRGV